LQGQQLKIEPPHITVCHHFQHRLIEAPSGSIQDPQCSLPIMFVVVPLAISLLLSQVKLIWEVSQVKLVWEAFPEAFCLHDQTI